MFKGFKLLKDLKTDQNIAVSLYIGPPSPNTIKQLSFENFFYHNFVGSRLRDVQEVLIESEDPRLTLASRLQQNSNSNPSPQAPTHIVWQPTATAWQATNLQQQQQKQQQQKQSQQKAVALQKRHSNPLLAQPIVPLLAVAGASVLVGDRAING